MGEKDFVFLPLECVEDKQKLYPCEQSWMDRTRSFEDSFGYNISPTAGGSIGVKFTPEGKQNISRAKVGKKWSEVAHQSAAKKVQTQATKDKRAESLRRAYSEGRHPGAGQALKGRPQTEEWKAKVSAAHKARGPHGPMSEEQKELRRGLIHTEEARAKISAAAKLNWAKKREAKNDAA